MSEDRLLREASQVNAMLMDFSEVRRDMDSDEPLHVIRGKLVGGDYDER